MGFPLVCYCFVIPKPVVAFFRFLSAVRDALLTVLSVVGLCSFPRDDRRSVDDAPLPEQVKEQLPAVEFGRLFLARPSSCCHDTAAAAAATTCIVCLEKLEAADEVRRLGNCAHAFHRGCIDRWIDLGRMTCPLCRAQLLGPRRAGRPARQPPHARLVARGSGSGQDRTNRPRASFV
ncbi:hypothetical protein BRADI_3g51810v3 [Brachypodium distachyon]|uniref:RING-type domain-containing protein n=1 Tax=Brachypodium distachyon TaxID=15368 RepID=I1ICN0_BRADI|nr:hypothetical protein BRADI_3g51810v3 [Brachypodium distachyon]